MKITKTQLKRIIREELDTTLGQENIYGLIKDALANAAEMLQAAEQRIARGGADEGTLRQIVDALEKAIADSPIPGEGDPRL
tara:strand:- start:435 stop:680 length:246 start_codon:yes stop_codon:yes gene_type:complete